MKELSKREWALFYTATLKLFIFPMVEQSKSFIKGLSWNNESTIDEDKIRWWWTQNPDYNIAMDCFKSKKIVFDVDMKGGKDGLRSAVELLGDQIFLLETKQARSPSGGFHFHYDYDYDSSRPDVRNSSGDLGIGLDIRANGGCCILPGSEVDGFPEPYRWELNNPETGKTMPCLPFPDILRTKQKGIGEATYLNAQSGSGEATNHVKIQDGRRDDYLISVAGLYRRGGASPEEIYAALTIRNAERCDPPKDDKDLWRIAKSAQRWEPAEPAAWSQPAKIAGGAPKPQNIALPRGGEVMDDAAFFARCSVEISWLIEGIVTQGGLLLLSAAPKAGKSTMARTMIRAIASGEPFLGRRTMKSKALWIGVAEPEKVLRSAIETMGLGGLGISWVVDRPNDEPWQTWINRTVETIQPDFVVVDEIGRLAKDLENINDYSQVVRATQPFLDLRSKYGTTFCLIHHDKKTGGTLGSTAWDGAVDCIMSLKRQVQIRTLQTMQRIGDDIEPTIIERDPETGLLSITLPKELADQRKAEQSILSALQLGRKMARKELASIPSNGTSVGRNAVDALLSSGQIEATGTGTKGDPRLYQRVGGGHKERAALTGTQEVFDTHNKGGVGWSGVSLDTPPPSPHPSFDGGGSGLFTTIPKLPHADPTLPHEHPTHSHATPPYPTQSSDSVEEIIGGSKGEERVFDDVTPPTPTYPTHSHATPPYPTYQNGNTSGLVIAPPENTEKPENPENPEKQPLDEPIPGVLEYALDVLGGYEEPDELPYFGES
jgi:hypothetical protein